MSRRGRPAPVPAELAQALTVSQPGRLAGGYAGRTGLVEVETADTLPEGWRLWPEWQRRMAPDNTQELMAVEADGGRHLGYLRVVGQRRPGVELAEYAWPDMLRAMFQGEARPS